MSNIVFIADFYVEQILGGGELNNEELYNILSSREHNIEKVRSHEVDVKFLKENKDSFFLVFNFVNLSQPCKNYMSSLRYAIYEHDHKYLKTRNPAEYKDFKAPSRDIINYHFYKNAEKVFCQSKFHKKIISLNLGLENIESLGGNLWSEDVLKFLRHMSKESKSNKCSIMDSRIGHKNTFGAIKYCTEAGMKYSLIKSTNYLEFLEKMGRNEKLVFLPQTPETLSRVIVEARMMGMSIATNSLVGATSEEWFSLKGEELIDIMFSKRNEIANKIDSLINNDNRKDKNKEKEISILATFFDASKYIDNFMNNITSQTIFDKCELIIIDANSQGKERKIIESYTKKYDNILYTRLSEKLKPTPCFNMAAQKASGKYLTFAFLDDVKSLDCIESLYNTLESNTKIDLCYGDVVSTSSPNEVFEESDISKGKLLEHSAENFSKENMIKCLPGPMPMWKKEVHEKNGFFDDYGHNYADDWEMWLRIVNDGSRFLKIDKVVGLYLEGGRSQQKENIEQRKEEATLFFKYSHLFGNNFNRYKNYFKQYL